MDHAYSRKNAYDQPIKYNKATDAYVVTMQRGTRNQPGIYEVTLAHGDRAIPDGYVEKLPGQHLYHTYMFAPGYAGSYEHANVVGTSVSLQEAIADVRQAWSLKKGLW
jgi:hypothetical protein